MPRAYVQPKAIIKSLQYLNPNSETIISTKTLTTVDSLVQKLDPGNDDIRVIMPDPIDCNGMFFYIINGSSAYGKLLVYDHTNTSLIVTITPHHEVKMICIDSDWETNSSNSGSPYVINFDPSMSLSDMQSMINGIPKDISSGLTVNFTPGSYTFEHPLSFDNFTGGHLSIYGHEAASGPLALNNEVFINNNSSNYESIFVLNGISSYTSIKNIDFGSDGVVPVNGRFLSINHCRLVEIYKVKVDGTLYQQIEGTGIEIYKSFVYWSTGYVKGFTSDCCCIHSENSTVVLQSVVNSDEVGADVPRHAYKMENDSSVIIKGNFIEPTSDLFYPESPAIPNDEIKFFSQIDHTSASNRVITTIECYKNIIFSNNGASADITYQLPDGESGMKTEFAGDVVGRNINVVDSSLNPVKTISSGELVKIVWTGSQWCSS